MYIFNTTDIHKNKLIHHLVSDCIVNVEREVHPYLELDRCRFKAFVKGKGLVDLNIVYSHNHCGPYLRTQELFELLVRTGIKDPEKFINVLKPKDFCSEWIHLAGDDKVVACGKSKNLPEIVRSTWSGGILDFINLPERKQCPYCRARIDQNYTPVWRFRNFD